MGVSTLWMKAWGRAVDSPGLSDNSRTKNNLFHSLHYALYLFLLWAANHRRKFVLNCVRTRDISLFIPRKAFFPPVIWGFNHRYCWHWGKIAWFTGECFEILRMIRKLSNHGESSYSWRKIIIYKIGILKKEISKWKWCYQSFEQLSFFSPVAVDFEIQ